MMPCRQNHRGVVQGVGIVTLGLLLGWGPLFASTAASQEDTPPLHRVVAQAMLACLSVQGHTAQVHAASAYTSIVLDGLWVMTLDTSRRNAFQHDAGLEIWLGDESIDGATVPPIVLRWTQSL